jgi:chitinase
MPNYWEDIQKTFTGDFNNDPSNALGCVKQLYLLKKSNRQMKTLLSIGGWAYSPSFSNAVATPEKRAKFASSAVQFVQDCGFDGLDIDWEYPDSKDALNLVSLLQAVRSTLDTYSSKQNLNYHFLLSIASPAGPDHYNKLQLKEMDQFLDQWNLMAYDYAGSFLSFTGHQANLYPSQSNSRATPFSTDKAIHDYIAAGVNASKIQIGMPIYGHTFNSTAGLGESFDVISSSAIGSWDKGIWDYKVLPKANAIVQYDSQTGATYSYDSVTRQLISYDTVDVVMQKAKYIKNHGLGGGFFWEASADKKGEESLIESLTKQLGRLDQSLNLLNYPLSKYPNIKANMSSVLSFSSNSSTFNRKN